MSCWQFTLWSTKIRSSSGGESQALKKPKIFQKTNKSPCRCIMFVSFSFLFFEFFRVLSSGAGSSCVCVCVSPFTSENLELGGGPCIFDGSSTKGMKGSWSLVVEINHMR